MAAININNEKELPHEAVMFLKATELNKINFIYAY